MAIKRVYDPSTRISILLPEILDYLSPVESRNAVTLSFQSAELLASRDDCQA